MARDLHAAYDALVDGGRIERDPAQEEAVAAFERLASRLDEPRSERRRSLLGRMRGRPVPRPAGVRGVYVWGGVGRGKSMLMDLFVDTVEARTRRVHFHAFMQEVHRGMNAARKRGVSDAIAPVADEVADGLALLALDEMQVGDVADAMIMGRLFERLLGAGLAVVTTSNRPPRDLYKDGLNRSVFEPFIELIEEGMEVVHLDGEEDFRKGGTGATYLTPIDAEARRTARDLWRQLGDGTEEPLVVRVHGREAELAIRSGGAARARFWELCGRPLGAADYLALAEEVDALILEDVPTLSRSNFNEARRFVTLVDALYEARTRLVVTAVADPDNLYVEGEGSFEFARTASRLREMTSEGWSTA
jgi:cell division protein ZapE